MPKPPRHNYTETINGISFPMIFVKGGEFFMGDNKGYRIQIPDFHIGQTPVTQEQWRAIMGADPPELYFKGNTRPVERVSWDDIVSGTKETLGISFLEAFNQKARYEGYQLPSESMWEYAARGGKRSEGYIYAGSNNLKEVGWYRENSHRETKPVGLKLPNELGLYDMSGNVFEWCADDWKASLEGTPADGSPRRVEGEKERMVRGGSWYFFGNNCRVAFRDGDYSGTRDNDLGFRLARY